MRSFLNSCGLSGVWNEGKGVGLEVGNVAKLVKGVLEDQEIQNGSVKSWPRQPPVFTGSGRRSGDIIFILSRFKM